MMTPIAGDERHFQSFRARQDYIPAVGLDLTEQQREMGNKDHKTYFQSPSCQQKSCQEVQLPALADPGSICERGTS